MSNPDATSWTAERLFALLAQRYATMRNGLVPATIMPEVSMHVGGGIARADAVAVGFTQAQGRVMEGFEIKVTPADWAHELSDPGKSEPWIRNCQRFWLVAPKEIVKDGELPEAWGHLAPNAAGNALRIIKRAPLLPGEPSWEASIAFISRCNSAGQDVNRYRENAKDAERKAAASKAREDDMAAAHRKCGDEAHLLEEVRRFEAETGIDLNEWNTTLTPRIEGTRPRISVKDLFESLILLRDGAGLENHVRRLADDAERMNKATKELGAALITIGAAEQAARGTEAA